MYIAVQKIVGKAKKYGYAKDVVTYTYGSGTTTYYGYRYSDERFEQENFSYKIVVKESYREDGKVKQRQVVVGTFHWSDFISGFVYPDECFYDKLRATFPNVSDEQIGNICDEVDAKIGELQAEIEEYWQSTEEYRVHNEHLEMIAWYEKKKKHYDVLLGEHYFEQIFDVHMNVMNQELYEQIHTIQAEKARKDAEQREYERKSYEESSKRYEDFFKNFNGSSYSIGSSSNYTDTEKGYLKKFYKVLATKFHPDVIGDNEPMQFLNKLKKEWGV